MYGCIGQREAALLRKPCENRGLKLEHNKEEQTVTIGDRVFSLMREAEDFLIELPRVDFGPIFRGF